MKYYDKRGDEIDETLWETLIRNEAYVAVLRHSSGTQSVTTSWLGIRTQHCQSRSLFVTVARRNDADVQVSWHDKPLDYVRRFHLALCAEMGLAILEA